MPQRELSHHAERNALAHTHDRYAITIERGEGCYFEDTDGRRYLDFFTGTGVTALGHGHPRLVSIIREQAGLCLHTSNLFHHRYQRELAWRLTQWSGLSTVFFSNSGTEAMEAALKAALIAGGSEFPKRRKFVALRNSFHGRSAGALSVTGRPEYREAFEPLPWKVEFIDANDCAALHHAVGTTTAAVVSETIQGEGGIVPLTPEFLSALRESTRRAGAFWIADETQCGLGRTGWRFAFQRFDLDAPDIIITAKAIAGGLPLGATIFSERASVFEPGMHGSTFGGGPLACRVAIEVLDLIDEMLPSVRKRGAFLFERLAALQARHGAVVREVRGAGLMAGIELSVPGEPLVRACLERGLAINCTRRNVLRLLPPLIVSEAEIEGALEILEDILEEVLGEAEWRRDSAGESLLGKPEHPCSV